MNRDLRLVPADEAPSTKHKSSFRALRRASAGARDFGRPYCGPPTRLPSGEWMVRIAFDLPEAMLDALEKRAGSLDDAQVGEVIRATLAAAGIGDASHVTGICDGTHSDDEDYARVQENMRTFRARLMEQLPNSPSK